MTPVGFWTDDVVERLRSLWQDDSISARMIADELGTTRNAVLGKAHRLELPDKRLKRTFVGIRQISGRRIVDVPVRKPREYSILVSTKFFQGQAPLRPAKAEFSAPVVRRGTSKTSPSYRNQLGFLPDMTVRERRNMLAEAVRNTAAMPVEG